MTAEGESRKRKAETDRFEVEGLEQVEQIRVLRLSSFMRMAFLVPPHEGILI